jgi:receptor protein-tyrosine kinase
METHRTVLLVDADPAKPGVAAALGLELPTPRGFLDVLRDPLIPLSEVMCRTNIGKLTVLPAGASDPRTTELFAGEGAGALLRELSARYDDRVVIFDTAPLLAASEASALAAHMGQIVLVVEAGRTTEKTLKEALERVESCNVAGVVLNKGAKPAMPQGGYGYGYGNAT